MSSRTVLFFWGVFLLLHVLDPGGNQSIPAKWLLNHHVNETSKLENLTFFNKRNELLPTKSHISELLGIHKLDGRNVSFYHNITGMFKGRVSGNLLEPDQYEGLNASALKIIRGGIQFRKTALIGIHLHSNVTPHAVEDVRYMEGHLRFKGRSFVSSQRLIVGLRGAHFLKNGTIWLTGVANGNSSGLLDIPEMMMDQDAFDVAKNLTRAVAAEYTSYLKERMEDDEDAKEDVETLMSKNLCKFFVVMQLHPLPVKYKERERKFAEEDMETPLPQLYSDALVFSPDCHILLRARNLRGLLIETFYEKALLYSLLVWVTSWIELYFTVKQMEYTTTQSALSKVSVVTIGMQTVVDAYLCMLHFAAGGTVQHLFLPFITASFFKFIIFSVFEMRYVLEISRAQRRDSDETVIGIMYSRFAHIFLLVYYFSINLGQCHLFWLTLLDLSCTHFGYHRSQAT
ncbi:hypothetical protein BC829DRAFT_41228 [Chytridium lagenaria]|nr:hypothetical protein BC829DRAFT_41228 [Chytridium lagenaria]